jgi:hypothetical protein
MLKALTASGLCAVVPKVVPGQSATSGRDCKSMVAAYLESLSRPDGGFAWADQQQSHLTPTFAVVGSYRATGRAPANKSRLAEFIRTHHPSQLRKLEQEHDNFDFQQIQSLHWLGEDVSAFRERVLSWKKPQRYMRQYEQHGYPVFEFQIAAFTCRELLGLPLDELSQEFIDYLNERRRACQLPNGGFTYQPNVEIAGWDDVAYTWAAVRSLKQLSAAPANKDACIRYLHSLRNADGGFTDRPGWASNPVATYYALDALDALDAINSTPAERKSLPRRNELLPSGLDVFSIQIEAHGQGSPAEAVDLALALHIHLWGVKNARPGWIARAQALADRANVPVRFFVSNEEYGTWVNVPGLGTYSHTSDIIAPAGVDFGPSLSNAGVVSWPEFRRRRLAPLQKAAGRVIWQFGENEELIRIYLDDSLQRGGYAAISTFHFGNPDFTNSEPFLNRYRLRIPFIALQDSHGKEPWWFADMTTGFRTVFLAREPSWEGWLEALQRNWVAAIRHDAVSKFTTWMHCGPPEAIEFIRSREGRWRWWDNPEIRRPLVSIVAVRPEDEFEAARPEKGIVIRVRTAWENTTQGLPKKPITELVKLTVDGVQVSPSLVEKKRRAKAGRGRSRMVLEDHYHQFHMADPAPGKHTVVARVRGVAGILSAVRGRDALDTTESDRTIEFIV